MDPGSNPESTPPDPDSGAVDDTVRGSWPAGEGHRCVLFVDDEPGAADLAAAHVDRLLDDVETVTHLEPSKALEDVRSGRVDCIVSDFDMPGSNGLEFLADARSIQPSIPFILFTGKGSEEIASEAVSAGVTDYLQKGAGRDRYEMLANSVANALQHRQAERDLRAVNEKVTAIHAFATDVAAVDSIDTVFARVVDAAEGILQFDRCVTARRDDECLVPVARSTDVGEDEIRTFELGEGIVGTTAVEQRTMVVDNLDAAAPDTPTATAASHADGASVAEPVADDIRSVISVPIGSHGVLQAVSSQCTAFDARDVEFAELLAAHAAEAIEQIKTESSLRTERDRLAALFENLPLPVARIVIDGDEPRLEQTNTAFEERFGYNATDHSYHEASDHMLPDSERRVTAQEAFTAEGPLTVEVQRRTVDGVGDFILHGIPVRRSDETVVYSVYADIGEQKRVERTLRKLHETTREMFRGEDREAIARIASRAAIDTLDFPSSGVRLYDPETNLLLPTALSDEATAALGDRPPFGPGDGRLWEAFETGDLIVVDDLTAVDTAIGYGELRSLLVVPLGDHGVMPLGSAERSFFDDTAVQLARVLGANLTVALDHAERTAELHQRDAELQRELDRLEKFAALVSHDLRNPLNVASGRLQLATDASTDEAVLAELSKVTQAHDRMEQLIDELLALARQGRTVDEVETVDLESVAREAWQTVDTGRATLTVVDGPISLEADPERLRTLLENLFTNSIEHGAVRDTHRSDGITVTVGAVDGGFYVADDGSGFAIDPESALEYGTSGETDGTGFGLAIVHEIAAAHGWEISVADADGARFVFHTTE